MLSLQDQLKTLSEVIARDPALAKQAAQLLIGTGHKNNEGENHPNHEGETTMPTMTTEQLKIAKHMNAEAEKAGLPLPYPHTDVGMTPEVLLAKLADAAEAKGLGREFSKLVDENTGAAATLFGSKTRARWISGNVIEFALKLGIVVAAIGAGLWIIKKVIGDQVAVIPMETA